MYKLYLLILTILFVRAKAGALTEHRPINLNFNDLYSQCQDHGGNRLCLGTFSKEEENFKLSKSECVKTKNCVMLFQFEVIEPDYPTTGEHCLYFDNEYKNRILRKIGWQELVLLGVRFGYESSLPKLESGCFLGESTDFLQVFYSTDPKERKLQRMKNGPAFEPAVVSFDNRPENSELIYCCFKQPLRIKIPNEAPFNEAFGENEIILDKKVYISTYYRIGELNNTLKLEQPLNLLDYKKRDIKKNIETLPTTERSTTTTTTTTTATPSSYSPTTSSEVASSSSSSDLELTTSTVKPTEPTQPYTDQSKEFKVDPLKSEEATKSGTSKALIIFIISIVLLVFFLLIAITIYNLLMKES